MSFKNFWIQYKVNNLPYEAQIHTESFVIGRSPDCDLTIVSEVVSRKHLKIEHIDNKIFIQDLGSTNGTFIGGELLKPKEKYEYKTGDKLYIDVNQQVVLRIIVLSNKAQVDIELDVERLRLEKKKFELKGKQKKFSQKDDFINNATDRVDNLFENILFVAKSARFNKEKAIKEAEFQSEELIEKARKEIEEDRINLENQIKKLQEETINEAKRTINSAHAKSKKIISGAEEQARELTKKTEMERQAVLNDLTEKKQSIINEAQEKHSEIIGEAYLKNKELKDENLKLQNEIFSNHQETQATRQKMTALAKEKDFFEKEHQQIKSIYEEELESLNALKLRFNQLQTKNELAQKVLNVEIPEKEKHLDTLINEIESNKKTYQEEVTKLDSIQDVIAKFQDQVKKDEDKASRAEKRVDELSNKVLEAEDNLFRLTKIKQQRTEEVEKEIAERKERQKLSEDTAHIKLEAKKAKTQKEIDFNLSKAKELATNMVAEAKAESTDILSQAKHDSLQILEQAQSDAERLSKDIKKEAESLLAHSKEKESKIIQKTKEEVEESLKLAKEKRKETDEFCKELYAKVKKETDELKALTKKETDEQRGNIKAIVDAEKAKVIQAANDEAQKIVNKACLDMKDKEAKFEDFQLKIKKDLEQELEKKKKETENELQTIRTNTVNLIEEQRKNFLKEEEQKNNIRVVRLRKELQDVLRARINPFLKESSHLEKVSQIIDKSINAIMLDEIDNNFIETENYSDFDPTLQQGKVKKFWLYTGITTLAVTLFFIFIPDFKQAAVDSSRSIAAKADLDTKNQIEQAQKINDLSKEFHPEKVEEYLESYTQRVLYTKGYVQSELDKNYREQWIIDLQEYFVHTLRLDENNLVPFIAHEANLIKELDEAMKTINGNFVKEGIAKMEEIESAFIKKIRENIKSKKDFDKIMQFKKDFFLKNNKTNAEN